MVNLLSDLTQVVTFYSYKGGVGRSMAVLNVSALLASRGFRVLVIDFDLEAPGLSHLLADTISSEAKKKKRKKTECSGIVDLLLDAKIRGDKSDLFAKHFPKYASRYTFSYPIPKELKASKDGHLFIMPAGETNETYSKRLNDLDLSGLYREGLGKGLIDHFKKTVVESGLYDFIIVDSRTGHSDEAGICTRDLADHLMIVSGFNRQNLAGTASFLTNLRASQRKEGGTRKDPMIILSPVPIGEEEMLARREQDAANLFKQAWGRLLPLDLFIPYHPRLALTEDAYVTTRTASYLRDSYHEIERRLLSALGQIPRELIERVKSAIVASDGRLAVLLLERSKKLSNSSTRNTPSRDDFYFALDMHLPLENDEDLLKKTISLPESLRILDLVVSMNRSQYRRFRLCRQLHELDYPYVSEFDHLLLRSKYLSADSLGDYANFLTDIRKDHDGAEAFYKRALEADPKQANHLGNYANFLTDIRKDHEGAEAFYERALEADPKHANNLGNYANFLTDIRKDHDGAEAFYKRALEADPKHGNHLGNYGQLLIGTDRLDKGFSMLQTAWKYSERSSKNNTAELVFSLWLASQLSGQNQPAWEMAFKHLVLSGFTRHPWNFDDMLKQAESKLSPALFKYANALADAFLDESKVVNLDTFPRWKKLKSVNPELIGADGNLIA